MQFLDEKATHLDYCESLMTHAAGINWVIDENGNLIDGKVENSRGDDNGDQGFFVMTGWMAR